MLDDHAFDSGFGVVAHPGAGDAEIGGHGHQHEAVRQLAAQEVFEEGAAGDVGLRADVGAGEGQDVEHDVGGRHRLGQLLGSPLAAVQALLQRGEVDPSLVPADEFTVERDVDVEPADRGCYLREVPGERSLLSRLQGNRVETPQSNAAEAIDLRFRDPAAGVAGGQL
jgi:hypothetical protein